MDTILFTIIIPHKDIPKLLIRCVSSIPKREDLEIIIIDDGSNPETRKEMEESGELHRREIEVIYNNECRGGGYARNLGLACAKGKWVLFADADDYFNYCLSNVLDEYVDSESDIIYFPGISLDTNTYMPTNRTRYVNGVIGSYRRNPQKAESELRYLFGEPWCKIVRRELIERHHVRFDETLIHNDTTFSYLVGYYANAVRVDNRAIYCVTTRENSVSVSIDEDRERTRIEVFARAERFFRDHNIRMIPPFHYRQMAAFLLDGRFRSFRQGMVIMRRYLPADMQMYMNIAKSFFRVMLGQAKNKMRRMVMH